MIERYQLRYFLAVVDAGNFSRAAAQVNVTQPTLSLGVAKLEGAVGAKLFVRDSHRVNLTAEGARLLAHARLIESEFNSLASRITDAAGSTIRLGVLATIPTRLIGQVADANTASGAPHQVEIVDGNERELLGRLERRRLDLALTIVRPGERRFASEVLFREGYSLAVAASHRVWGRGTVSAEELAGEPMIVRRHCEVLSQTSRHFTERGIRPPFSYRSTNDDRTLGLVRAGLGLTVMPDSYADQGDAWPKLIGFDLARDIGLLFGNANLAQEKGGVFDALRGLRGAACETGGASPGEDAEGLMDACQAPPP